jgi:stearoyl-CoA desaturase (delta-9 desaturase)
MNTHAHAALATDQQRPFITRVPAARMRHTRVIYASAVLILPLAGSILAAIRGTRDGVGALELWSLATMYVATMLGITVGYHRGLSHRAFVAHPALESVLLAFAAMAGQGPALQWVADHRRHHQFSDRAGDPHSPHVDGSASLSDARGWWHAHVGWMFTSSLSNTLYYCRDLLRNPRVRFFNRSYPLWVVFGLLLPALAAYSASRDVDALISGFVWGGLVRLALSSHAAFAINSLAHMFGTRPFDTGDHSRNLAWLAIPTLGESWHNNHHAQPSSAYFGLRASQIDIGGWFIATMSSLGLLTRVRTAQHQARKSP